MDLSCLFAAILFFIGNILFILYDISAIEDAQKLKQGGFLDLDPTFIRDLWIKREELANLELVASLVNAGAWAMFAVPMLQLAWILSLGGKRKMGMHISIVVLVLGACLTEFLSLLFTVGMSNVIEYVTYSMNLSRWTSGSKPDYIGFRVVELCSLVYSGMVLWIECFDWLALSISLFLIYLSTCGLMNAGAIGGHAVSFTFGKCWAHFGLFISLMCFIDFASQVLRALVWKYFTEIGLLIGIMNRLVLFPLWLCCLGKQLTVAAQSIEITKNSNLQQNQVEQDQREQDSGIEMGVTNNEDGVTVDIPLSN